MTGKQAVFSHSLSSPPTVSPDTAPGKQRPVRSKEPSRKPDWLLIWVSILFLLTLLIAWLVDFPALLR